MNFISWDQERGLYPGEIANRAMRFAIVRASVENIALSAPEVTRPAAVHPAPIAGVVEGTIDATPVQSEAASASASATAADTVTELSRRAQQEARSASSLIVESETYFEEAV